MDRRQLVTADFWMMPASALEEARRLKDLLAQGGSEPTRYEGYTQYTNTDLETLPAEFRYFVRQAPLGQTTVVGLSGDQWILLHVSRRLQRTPSFEDSRATLQRRLQPYIAEYNLLRELRSQASIKVDTTQFVRAMAFAD